MERKTYPKELLGRVLRDVIDDDTLQRVLPINDELFDLGKWLNEQHDTKVSSRLIPLVDQTHAYLAR